MSSKKKEKKSLNFIEKKIKGMMRKYNEEYYIQNGIIYERVIKEHDKGHRPIEHIEKDYFEELGLKNVSMRFFKWYLEKHCSKCNCELCGCDKDCCDCEDIYSYDYEERKIVFYDIVACSEQLKKEDIKKLKDEYAKDNEEKKTKDEYFFAGSDEYFFARIEYFTSPTRWDKVRDEGCAIIYRDKAYRKGNKNEKGLTMKPNPSEYDHKIIEPFSIRPKDMDKEIADNIEKRLKKSNPNITRISKDKVKTIF